MRAAQAVETALRAESADADVQVVDVLDYANPLFRVVYDRGYVAALGIAPTAVGWCYDRIDRPFRPAAMRSAGQRLMMRRLVRLVERERPDTIICTHFLPAEIVASMRRRGLPTHLAVVVTDIDAHAVWLHDGVDHYFVALDETAAYLRALGVEPDCVTVSGIPIDPCFAVARSSLAMRHRHGLALDRPILLVATGGLGIGPLDQTVDALLGLRTPAQIVVVCGRNEALRVRLVARADDANRACERLRVIGFTQAMHELMSAADLLIGKPGGLSTSEAAACGLPVMILNPVPGQEERNSDHLLEEGMALRCNMIETLAWKVERFLVDEARRAAMRSAALRRARPDAAHAVVETLRRAAGGRGRAMEGALAARQFRR